MSELRRKIKHLEMLRREAATIDRRIAQLEREIERYAPVLSLQTNKNEVLH